MRSRKVLKIVSAAALLLLSAMPVKAQDMLARQAPVDRRMKTVDTLTLKHLRVEEEIAAPSSDIYNDWNNQYAHRQSNIPDNYKIDLRHFCMPTKSRVVTSNYGYRAAFGRDHKGIDIKVYIGDTIRAAFSGKVRIVKYEAAGYGKYIVIRHSNGLETIYGHLSKQLVSENQTVRAGEVIGLGGNTGRSTGSHLHFETRLGGVALNPALLFDFRNQDVTGDYYVYHRSTVDSDSREANAKRGKVGNGSYNPDMVRGDEMPVVKMETSGDTRYHKVASGETLESIAEKYDMSVDELCRLNGIKRGRKVVKGQLLKYS